MFFKRLAAIPAKLSRVWRIFCWILKNSCVINPLVLRLSVNYLLRDDLCFLLISNDCLPDNQGVYNFFSNEPQNFLFV